MKKFFDILFGRAILLLTAFFLQISAVIFLAYKFHELSVYLHFLSITLSTVLLVFLIAGNKNPAYKISWIIPLLLFPTFGWVLYMLFSSDRFSKLTKKKQKIYYEKHLEELSKTMLKDSKILQKIKNEAPAAMRQMKYLVDFGDSQIFENDESIYLDTGEKYFEVLLDELKKAKSFIFMEYFIIASGHMWDKVLEILIQKVREGVEIRVIYDDLGCISTLPRRYYNRLEALGIKCCAFNKANLIFTIIYNNRTHRKITVIDGKVAFTGGVNLADEYINKIDRFGHWKDTGICIKGEGVWGFTVMFLNIWKFLKKVDEDFYKYKCHNFEDSQKDGYIIPFSDSPLDKEIVGSNVYLSLINSAVDYIYINTPYLIIDHEMTQALCLASKKGVDVRITTPYIPDKKTVFEVTKSNFNILMASGVKIYAYTPGFIHAKSFVVDDKYAVVGTINLDYRSLYLHFECGLWLYNSKTILDIKKDYLDTLTKCYKYTSKDLKNVSKMRKLYRAFLKMFSPIL